MTTTTTPTFHPFQRLSFELRARIWELSVEPRTVDVRVVYHYPGTAHKKECGRLEGLGVSLRHLRSSTPAPAQLQTCREAREYLTTHPQARYLYNKAFSEIATSRECCICIDLMPTEDAERERYVWINFELDTVSIGETESSEFEAEAHRIYRLRLERDLDDEYFARSEEDNIFKLFRNLREIYFVCLYYGIRSGYRRAEYTYPLDPENVYFLDPEGPEPGSLMMNSVDLDAMVIREYLSSYPLEDLDTAIPDELWEELMMQKSAREEGNEASI
ncbi:hypothetical protein VTL71DRAFT_11086 [Oculimacula yallundae]|uniref:2EXR domain-containing protein n=1 Tax=Oculimacula yallundae TaxID=86028 RepID=A0ABR4CUX5_9HELO